MDMKTSFGTYKDVHLQLDNYVADGSIAIGTWNKEDGPIATLTVA